jgi:hypothetical protein
MLGAFSFPLSTQASLAGAALLPFTMSISLTVVYLAWTFALTYSVAVKAFVAAL